MYAVSRRVNSAVRRLHLIQEERIQNGLIKIRVILLYGWAKRKLFKSFYRSFPSGLATPKKINRNAG
jgi:hypothetical protein